LVKTLPKTKIHFVRALKPGYEELLVVGFEQGNFKNEAATAAAQNEDS
jgi:hypothetical protein